MEQNKLLLFLIILAVAFFLVTDSYTGRIVSPGYSDRSYDLAPIGQYPVVEQPAPSYPSPQESYGFYESSPCVEQLLREDHLNQIDRVAATLSLDRSVATAWKESVNNLASAWESYTDEQRALLSVLCQSESRMYDGGVAA